jgi:rhodanese-related sulfurtransferase
VIHLVTQQPVSIPLAGPASKQGRLVADHIAGKPVRYQGAQGTAIVKVFDLSVASTGLNVRQLRQADIPYQNVTIHIANHAGYYPGASPMAFKLLFGSENGNLLGAQIVGKEGVDKRIDVIATAMRAGMTVFDLETLELAYAPPYGAARDPVNIVGFVASNILRGDSKMMYWDEIDDIDPTQDYVLDVRNPPELRGGVIEGQVNIPLPELRNRLNELPRDRRIVVYCQAGQRAYYAYRILAQNGFDVINLCGGYNTYSHAAGHQSSVDVFDIEDETDPSCSPTE